ncbi:MAG: methyl-accepting chemotaxis protein [Gammaproteobacteria bacterium]|nr:methyl-accepting chemotaxis protein [Gammaproteobacteria bacterium]
MSLRVLIVSVLLLLGTVAVSIIMYQSYSLQSAAENAQRKTLSNILRITSNEVVEKTSEILAELAGETQKPREFKKAIRKLMKDPSQSEANKTVVDALNLEFYKKFVTANIVKLKKIRLYDLDFNFITESTEGLQFTNKQLPEQLLLQAKPRKKTDRLKIIGTLWQHQNQTLYSILAPLGGLRQLGYMEVTIDLSHNLKNLDTVTGLPIQILLPDETAVYTSENWEALQNESSLIIKHSIRDNGGEAMLTIQAIEDLSSMYANFKTSNLTVVIVASIAFGAALILSLFLMKLWVFTPLKHIASKLQQISSGDMTTKIEKSSFISEINQISDATHQMVTDLDDKLQDIFKYAKQLNDTAITLDQQSQRAVENARHQQLDLSDLETATVELDSCGEAVKNIASETSVYSQETNKKAIDGKNVVTQAEISIESLSSEINSVTASVADLKNNIGSVDSILDAIENIAEQTNLLALNAAIESARAGENGRGFAVVADEVRSLANRTQTATHEVQQIIDKLKKGVEKVSTSMASGHGKMQNSVEQVKEARDALAEITEVVSRIMAMNQKVSESANFQNEISQKTKQNINSITHISKQVSSDAETLTSSSLAISQIAQKLDNLLHAFVTTASR